MHIGNQIHVLIYTTGKGFKVFIPKDKFVSQDIGSSNTIRLKETIFSGSSPGADIIGLYVNEDKNLGFLGLQDVGGNTTILQYDLSNGELKQFFRIVNLDKYKDVCEIELIDRKSVV